MPIGQPLHFRGKTSKSGEWRLFISSLLEENYHLYCQLFMSHGQEKAWASTLKGYLYPKGGIQHFGGRIEKGKKKTMENLLSHPFFLRG